MAIGVLVQQWLPYLPRRQFDQKYWFGDDATHTFGTNPYLNEPGKLSLPLIHPNLVIRSVEADLEIVESLCVFEGYRVAPPPLSRRILNRVPLLLPLLRWGRQGIRRLVGI